MDMLKARGIRENLLKGGFQRYQRFKISAITHESVLEFELFLL